MHTAKDRDPRAEGWTPVGHSHPLRQAGQILYPLEREVNGGSESPTEWPQNQTPATGQATCISIPLCFQGATCLRSRDEGWKLGELRGAVPTVQGDRL